MVWSFYAAGGFYAARTRRRDSHAGLVVLKLDDLLEAKHKPISKWYPLGEKTQRSGGDGSRGVCKLSRSGATTKISEPFSPDFPFRLVASTTSWIDKSYEPHRPNETCPTESRTPSSSGGEASPSRTRIYLVKGATSDPRVRFELLGGQFSDDKNERKKQEKERHFK